MKAVMNKISGLTFGKNLRLRSKLLLITAIVFVGYTVSVLLGMVTLNQVKIGSKTYASIKNYNDSLFQLALLKSDLNEFHSDLISLTHASKEKMPQIKDSLDGEKNRHRRKVRRDNRVTGGSTKEGRTGSGPENLE